MEHETPTGTSASYIPQQYVPGMALTVVCLSVVCLARTYLVHGIHGTWYIPGTSKYQGIT